jgi:glyoxylase-like metal-dependent hydrolase (beta-lactamase superfamily II)
MSTRHKHREKTLAYMTDWLKASGADDLTADAGFSFSLSMIPFYESDKLVSGGEEFRLTDEGDGWEIVWTPGHTNGHFVLYNRQRKMLL